MRALKASIKVAFVIVITLAVVVFAQSFGAFSQAKTIQSSVGIPPDVANVLNNSCVGCHGGGDNPMALEAWNFNKWDTYNVKKQAKKSNAMCKAITKGKMPPPYIGKANPERIPTVSQTELICRWANSLKLK